MKENDPIPTLAPTWGADVFSLLSWFKQERLERANVMVVGCGALGNEVLKNLALFGVGHLVVVDFDTIEPSNLTPPICGYPVKNSSIMSIRPTGKCSWRWKPFVQPTSRRSEPG